MIEIDNASLAKVLNLWTETEEWESGSAGWLHWSNMAQRRADGSLIPPCGQDKEAHALVKFMLKERKYPNGTEVFYPSGGEGPEMYIVWIKDWEKRFGDKPQDDQPKDVDHSIPVRYDHLISTSEKTTPEILDELEKCRKELCKPSSTKAERFYAFLTTPQPDISPGLWGLEREPEAPVRGGDGGWVREDVGGLTSGYEPIECLEV